MAEIVQWAETGLRAALGVIFMLIPGITFWLAVLGLWVMVQKLGRSSLYQVARNKVRVVFSH